MGDAEARMLAALNGLIFGFLAAMTARNGGVLFAAFAALSLAFWISMWCAGRRELRPLIATWLALIGCFAWSVQGESLGPFDGGLMLLLIAAYLATGLIVVIVLYREARRPRRQGQPARPMLERNRHG